MARFLVPFFVAFAVVIGVPWLWLAERPESIFNLAYAEWLAKFDLMDRAAPRGIAILGDSTAMVGLLPEKFGSDAINVANGGGSPIDLYVFSRHLLDSSHRPRAVVVSQGSFSFAATGPTFWEYTVAFHLADPSLPDEVRRRARALGDDFRVISVNRPETGFHLLPQFGPKTPGDLEARLKVFTYRVWFPSAFAGSFRGAIGGHRAADTAKARGDFVSARGHLYYPVEKNIQPGYEAILPRFIHAPVLDSYMDDALALYRQAGVPVYFVSAPISDLTRSKLPPRYIEDYTAYLQALAQKYPNFHLLGEIMPVRPVAQFSDLHHLNAQGAEAWSADVVRMLREAGVEHVGGN